MNSQPMFFALAGALLALVVGLFLPFVWRGRRRNGPVARRRAWISTIALVVAVPGLAFGVYGLHGDLGAVGEQRSVLSERLRHSGIDLEADVSPPGCAT